MNVILFPDNKLNATLEPIYNGHQAIITVDTDRLKDYKYEVAELELFRNNIQGTSFLNPVGDIVNENADYEALLKKISNTGRISFGIYLNTDSWVNPLTHNFEGIPDYYAEKWSEKGASLFENAVSGATKITRYPNHGQQLYDVSNGAFGFDFNSNTIGDSELKETYNCIQWQIERLNSFLGKKVSVASYMNGQNAIKNFCVPFFLGARNSFASFSGAANVSRPAIERAADVDKESSTRTWDTWRSGQFASFQSSIEYTQNQIQAAIDTNGWWQDFMHWHSLYDFDNLTSFASFFSAVKNKIETGDVWKAGYNEVLEYSYLKGLIDLVGSYEHQGDLHVFYRVKDLFNQTYVDSIHQGLNEGLLMSPVSIRISTIGTALEGKDINCKEATVIRRIDLNTWVVSVPFYNKKDEGIQAFKIFEQSVEYWNESTPALVRSGNVINSSFQSKWVIWRKSQLDSLHQVREVFRSGYLLNAVEYQFESGYTYYVGAVSTFRQSSLIEFDE